MHGTAVENYS